MSDSALLHLDGVTKEFRDGSGKIVALKPTDFSVYPGEFVGIIGTSGSGKSTFLTVAGGLQNPLLGRLVSAARTTEAYQRKKRMPSGSMRSDLILQSSNLIPFLSVEEQFHFVDILNKTDAKDEHTELLDRLGLGDELNKYPSDLSGGQLQRAAIARAMANKPSILLADEPTASLDTDRAFQIVDILATEAHENQNACIMVTHDQRMLDKCDKLYEMKDGVMHEVPAA